MISIFVSTFIALSIMSFIYTVFVFITKFIDQKILFKKAKKRAEATNKPLLVIGCPKAGAVNKILRAYSHGSICLDIDGCPKCTKYDINSNFLQDFPDNHFVLFESDTFCFSKNFPALIKNVSRITGGDFYLYGTNRYWFYTLIGRKIYNFYNRDTVDLGVAKYEAGQRAARCYDYNRKNWITVEVD
jgi:hypothetical protein